MLCQLLYNRDVHFWKSQEFENVANPYFKGLKHLQDPRNLSLNAPSMHSHILTKYMARKSFYDEVISL